MSGRILSGAHAEVSITGTPIAHIPLNGRPEFAGLAVDDDTAPIMTVLDGALEISTDDREVAVAHRDAWQQAIDNYDARRTSPRAEAYVALIGQRVTVHTEDANDIGTLLRVDEETLRLTIPGRGEDTIPLSLVQDVTAVLMCGARGCAREIRRNLVLGQWEHVATGEAACWPDNQDSTFADPCATGGEPS